jgi:hypothetical protein
MLSSCMVKNCAEVSGTQMAYFDLHKFYLFNKKVSKLGMSKSILLYICKSFCVSKFGGVSVTSTPAKTGFLGPLQY